MTKIFFLSPNMIILTNFFLEMGEEGESKKKKNTNKTPITTDCSA